MVDGPSNRWKNTVQVPIADLSVYSLSRQCDVPQSEIYAHNDGLEQQVRAGAVPIDARVTMPAGCVLRAPSGQRVLPRTEPYVVQKNEVPGILAERAGVSLSTLRALNNIPRGKKWTVFAGKTIKVPADSPLAREQRTYTVPRGTYLWRIAKFADVTTRGLVELNGLPSENEVNEGSSLVMPQGSRFASALQLLHRRSPTARHDEVLLRYAELNEVPAALIKAMSTIESRGDVNAESHAGAFGVLQVTPGAATQVGVEMIRAGDTYHYRPLSDHAKQHLAPFMDRNGVVRGADIVHAQAYAGTRYVRWLMDRYDVADAPSAIGDHPWAEWELVLAGYNAGIGHVREHGGVPPFRETQDYIANVPLLWQYYELAPQWRREGDHFDPALMFAGR